MMTQITPPIRLLLVDDEIAFLDSTAKALSRRGFSVRRAQDGRAAVLILERKSFDVAVIDVKMPGFDGLELFQTIRRRWPSLPVIILTGHGSVTQAYKTCRDGLFEYMTKPCDIEELSLVAHRAVSYSLQQEWTGEAPPFSGMKVLLVDDEDSLAVPLTRILRRRGVRVVRATSGLEAMDHALAQVFDVVVFDGALLEEEGPEVRQHLERIDPTVQILVVADQGTSNGAVLAPDIHVLLDRIDQAYRKRIVTLRGDSAGSFVPVPMERQDRSEVTSPRSPHE